jgi:S1-C subfamily serine protease
MENFQQHIKKHRNLLYVLIFLLMASQIYSLWLLNSQVSDLNSKIESNRVLTASAIKQTEDAILGLFLNHTIQEKQKEAQYQQNFRDISSAIVKLNELYKEVSKQQNSFDEDIKQLKSSKGDFSGIIEDSLKGVVSVVTDTSMGTGFIVHDSGIIVTNLHVISKANQISVVTYDGEEHRAVSLGENTLRDIALLKISGNYKSLKLADSDSLKIGSKVIAIGNPLGLSFTVTEGIISGLKREGENGLDEYIQTDVPLNPGNSGGPLIGTFGEVVGINNFKIKTAENIGFALESNAMKKSINAIYNETLL